MLPRNSNPRPVGMRVGSLRKPTGLAAFGDYIQQRVNMKQSKALNLILGRKIQTLERDGGGDELTRQTTTAAVPRDGGHPEQGKRKGEVRWLTGRILASGFSSRTMDTARRGCTRRWRAWHSRRHARRRRRSWCLQHRYLRRSRRGRRPGSIPIIDCPSW